jgi:hypothetical protein
MKPNPNDDFSQQMIVSTMFSLCINETLIRLRSAAGTGGIAPPGFDRGNEKRAIDHGN